MFDGAGREETDGIFTTQRVIGGAVVLSVTVAVLSWAAPGIFPWGGSPASHSVCETVAICTALFVAALCWTRFRATGDRTTLLIACTFIATALLDAIHAVATRGGPYGPIPEALAAFVPWSWLASRTLLGVGLYLSWLAVSDERIDERLTTGNIPLVVLGLTVATLSVILILPFAQSTYPRLWVPRPAEWIPGAFFGLALYGYWRQGLWRSSQFQRWMMASLVVATFIQFFVMPFSGLWYDGRFDAAHALKVVSYAFVAVGVFAEILEPSRSLERLHREHEASVAELARASEGLRVFVRSASHDLKAPIRHIAGFSGFLLEDAKDRLTEREADDLRRIRQAAEHMSKLLESLLRFAKFDAASVQPIQFSVNQAVDAAVVQLPREDQSRVTYEDLGDLVGDQSLLTLVFQNLIENGLKYTRQHDSHVVVRTESVDEGVMVSVSDDGIGVDPEQSNRIFEPGVRAVGESEFEGTGFGLATCARIIQAHEGRIWVEPNPTCGSTFKFVLPEMPSANA